MLKKTYLEICVFQMKQDINVEVFNMTARTNEAKTLVIINNIYDRTKIDSNQKRNNNDC